MPRDGDGVAFLLPFLSSVAEIAAPLVTAASAITTVAPHFFGGGYAPVPGTGPIPYGGAPIGPFGPILPAPTDVSPWPSAYGLAPRGEQGLFRLPGDFSSASLVPGGGMFGPGAVGPWTFGTGSVGGAGLAMIPRGIAGVESVVPKWLQYVAGGAAVAAAIYEEYKRLRGTGETHKQAKKHAHQRAGLKTRRRRMRSTNIHALRRAVRRLRGFRRAVRKVHGVLVTHTGGRGPVTHRRRRHRGDLDPDYAAEDAAELEDELEDYEVEPEFFRTGE